MGAIIRGVAVSQDAKVRSSIAHAAAAGRACIAAAGVEPREIGLLINCGVYRDDNMLEPAMAALIQRELGLGLDPTKHPGEKTVLSFDLMNGACGVLNAVQVAGAFLASGGVDHVLIVASDAHPSNQDHPSFPYANMGGAMLLGRGEREGAGLGRLAVRASAGGPRGVEGYLRFGPRGRVDVTVEREPGYAERLGELAAATVRDYVEAERLDLRETLLVTSQPSPDFAARLAGRLGLGEGAALSVSGVTGEPHSAALMLGYHQALARGLLQRFAQVLFVAAGAGLSCACAIYRP